MLLQPGTLPGLLSSGRRKRGLDLEAWATGCPGEGLMGAWRGGGGLCDGQHGLTDCTSPWLCGDRHTGEAEGTGNSLHLPLNFVVSLKVL